MKVRRPAPIKGNPAAVITAMTQGYPFSSGPPFDLFKMFGPGSFFPVALTRAELDRWYWDFDEWQFDWNFTCGNSPGPPITIDYDYTNPGDFTGTGDLPHVDDPVKKRRRLNGRLVAFSKGTDTPNPPASSFLQMFDLRPVSYTPPDPLLATYFETFVLYDAQVIPSVAGRRYYPLFKFDATVSDDTVGTHFESTATNTDDLGGGIFRPWIPSGVSLFVANPPSADIAIPLYRQDDGATAQTNAIRVQPSQYIATL